MAPKLLSGSAAPNATTLPLRGSLPPPRAGEGWGRGSSVGTVRHTRRRILLAAAGAGLASLAPAAGATEDTMAEAIRDLIGEAPVTPGKVKLELPSIVENGNTVPLTVSV